MAPRFWMALIRLTMTFFFAIAMAPLERQTVTIIGSISGVRPTATASAKKNASCHFPFVSPLMTKTSGTMTMMKRIMSQVKRATPRSNAVSTGCASMDPAMLPRYVRRPVATTAAVAVPLSTLVPRNARSARSIAERSADCVSATNFSTGNDSPVRELCITNRSLAVRIRTSAGTMSPAPSLTMSPGTRCVTGSSCGGWPSRNTAAVTEIIAFSAAAVLSARRSCVSRRTTPRTIITDITMPARASPVEKEMDASTASRTTSGLMTACQTSTARLLRWSAATVLSPCSASRAWASSVVSPPGRVRRRW